MVQRILDKIRDIPDFPRPGIVFKDITPVLQCGSTFQYVMDLLAEKVSAYQPERLIAIESRGFIFGAALAERLKVGFALVRKPGKLPYATRNVSYELEYGSDTLEMHTDAVEKGQRVAIIDDVLATGGTAAATVHLAQQLGAEVACVACLIELGFLEGHRKFAPTPFEHIIRF